VISLTKNTNKHKTVEEFIKGNTNKKEPITVEELSKLLNTELKERSSLAYSWYTWLTNDLTETKKLKDKDIQKYLKDAIALSAVFESMIEASNRMAIPFKEGITPAFKRQLAMLITTIALRKKYPIQSKRSLHLIQHTSVKDFVSKLDPDEVTNHKSKNKTYI